MGRWLRRRRAGGLLGGRLGCGDKGGSARGCKRWSGCWSTGGLTCRLRRWRSRRSTCWSRRGGWYRRERRLGGARGAVAWEAKHVLHNPFSSQGLSGAKSGYGGIVDGVAEEIVTDEQRYVGSAVYAIGVKVSVLAGRNVVLVNAGFHASSVVKCSKPADAVFRPGLKDIKGHRCAVKLGDGDGHVSVH